MSVSTPPTILALLGLLLDTPQAEGSDDQPRALTTGAWVIGWVGAGGNLSDPRAGLVLAVLPVTTPGNMHPGAVHHGGAPRLVPVYRGARPV